MTDEEQIRHIMALYCQHVDDHDWPGYSQVFAEDAQLFSQGRENLGLAAIKKQAEENVARRPPNRRTKHVCSNSAISVTGDEATSISDVMVHFRVGEDPWTVGTVGRYHDKFSKRDGRWLITERTIKTE